VHEVPDRLDVVGQCRDSWLRPYQHPYLLMGQLSTDLPTKRKFGWGRDVDNRSIWARGLDQQASVPATFERLISSLAAERALFPFANCCIALHHNSLALPGASARALPAWTAPWA
jgi:hypothetical protein